MKTIEPITIWFNGKEEKAFLLAAYASGDNLIDSASFSYQLLTGINNPDPMGLYGDCLSSGVLIMSGEVYQNWQTNDYAYDWVASQLNLTITGEYVPPTYNVEQTEA